MSLTRPCIPAFLLGGPFLGIFCPSFKLLDVTTCATNMAVNLESSKGLPHPTLAARPTLRRRYYVRLLFSHAPTLNRSVVSPLFSASNREQGAKKIFLF